MGNLFLKIWKDGRTRVELPVVRTIHLQLHDNNRVEAISTDAKPELTPGDLGVKARASWQGLLI